MRPRTVFIYFDNPAGSYLSGSPWGHLVHSVAIVEPGTTYSMAVHLVFPAEM